MLETTYTIALLVGGTALAFQFVMMLLGFGDDGSAGDVAAGDAGGFGDIDVDHPGGHWFYEIISLRTLSAAVTFFGLTGKSLRAYDVAELPSFVFAVLVGLAAMYAVYWLFQQVYRLQHAGNENIRNAVGLPATVYVPIPAARGGTGKVTFRMQNRLVEYQAVTEDGERLATGEKVIVVGIVNSDTVSVKRERSAATETATGDSPPPTNLASSATG